ncbi:MAG: DoxX family protein [Solirubrobacterales bacterium]|nr:DoxX family protein [Solirubrobacterales bacterium]
MKLIKALCGPFFIFAGAMHFIKPRFYLQMMPEWLPAHEAMNYASGVAEIAGGAALICPSPRVRRSAGWWLIATLLAVFPANLNMALNAEQFPAVPGGEKALFARLPFQAVFIAWVVSAMRSKAD